MITNIHTQLNLVLISSYKYCSYIILLEIRFNEMKEKADHSSSSLGESVFSKGLQLTHRRLNTLYEQCKSFRAHTTNYHPPSCFGSFARIGKTRKNIVGIK